MFTKMKNIDTAFRYTRAFNILFLIACLVLFCYLMYSTQRTISENRGKVYVLINGKLVEAVAIGRNLPVEISDHVQDFANEESKAH